MRRIGSRPAGRRLHVLERLERRQIIEAPAGEAEPSERLRYLEEQEPEIVEGVGVSA